MPASDDEVSRERPPFSPSLALLVVARRWEAALGEALGAVGLTSRRFGLLGHIRATPGISFSELARRSGITVQSAHAAVGALVADGLVADAGGGAGSASRLDLTAAGERVLAGGRAAVADVDARFLGAHPALAEALRAVLADRGTGTFS